MMQEEMRSDKVTSRRASSTGKLRIDDCLPLVMVMPRRRAWRAKLPSSSPVTIAAVIEPKPKGTRKIISFKVGL